MLKIVKLALFSFLALALLASVASGCALIPSAQPSSRLNLADEAWEIISRDYVDQSKVDSTKLGRGAIQGMLDALDDPSGTATSPARISTVSVVPEGVL